MTERAIDLATAIEVQPGTYQAECPTVHALYLSTACKRTSVAGRAAIWTVCALCDADLHTFDDCDPLAPQSHLYFLEARHV